MDEQYQQLEAGSLPLAALATAVAVAEAEHREIVRIAQAAQRAIGTSYASDRLPYLHRIVRNAFPDRDFSRERWQAILTGPEPAQEENEPERTCTCTACGDPVCQGDCDRCDNHRCEQCYDGHEVWTCCGYCTECDSHPDGYDHDHSDARCGECGYCSDCEHSCD